MDDDDQITMNNIITVIREQQDTLDSNDQTSLPFIAAALKLNKAVKVLDDVLTNGWELPAEWSKSR